MFQNLYTENIIFYIKKRKKKRTIIKTLIKLFNNITFSRKNFNMYS